MRAHARRRSPPESPMPALTRSPRDPGLRAGPLSLLRRGPRARAALPLGGLRLSLRCRPRRRSRALLRDRRFGRELPPDLRPARPGAPRRLLRARRPLDARPRAAGAHPPARPRAARLHLAPHRRPRPRDRRRSPSELVDRSTAAGFDLLPAFAEPLPVIVIARLLGVPEAMADQLPRLVARDGRHVPGPPRPRRRGRRQRRRPRLRRLSCAATSTSAAAGPATT